MELFKAKLGSPITQLADNITNTQTTISLVNADVLPDAPNIATIGTGVNAETIRYSGKTLNTLTGVTRGFTGTAKAWTAGQAIARIFTQYDHDSLVESVGAKANKIQEDWIEPTLMNGWVASNDLGYMKDEFGFVYTRGTLGGGTLIDYTVLFILPTGYRPANTRYFLVPNNVASNTFATIYVTAAGEVAIRKAVSNVNLFIEGITFKAGE